MAHRNEFLMGWWSCGGANGGGVQAFVAGGVGTGQASRLAMKERISRPSLWLWKATGGTEG